MMRYEVTRWLINGEIRRRSTENQEYAEAIAGRSTGNQVYVGPIAKNRQKNEPKTRSGNPQNAVYRERKHKQRRKPVK
jgi:hypothetical protein